MSGPIDRDVRQNRDRQVIVKAVPEPVVPCRRRRVEGIDVAIEKRDVRAAMVARGKERGEFVVGPSLFLVGA
ncbi:MAG TPA: hypothetical protein PK640_10740 [Verrucomicrobiota bacterium]|nr:hypothetical protein [Verrucomicrobiota bacterium]